MLEVFRCFTSRLIQRQPGLLFDVLLEWRNRHGDPPAAGTPGVPWCSCDNCRDMPTDREKVCCGHDHCSSALGHFLQICLDEAYLRVHRQYWGDVTGLGNIREPGDDNREFRYAAYRHYIFWQYGSLGQGNRRVIPSCCVCKIRDKFPDPHGQYAGFQLTI